jgi:diguanylate cyclase (GGDEF)-like protein
MDIVYVVNFAAAALMQGIAAIAAFFQIPAARRYDFGFAWLCISLGLVVMLQRRIIPLYEVYTDPVRAILNASSAVLDSFLALGISALMMVGTLGLRALFRTPERQAEALRQQAETDALTGLRNRRSMTRDALREVYRVHRSGSPLTAIMIDLDRFKETNDRYGHEAGDAVLAAVAQVLRENLRDIDLSARWGGEEFLVLLPDTDLAVAGIVAERLRRSLADFVVAVGADHVSVTASFGVSTLCQVIPGPEAALAELIRKSDQALYRAKEAGRNRVALSAIGHEAALSESQGLAS